MEKFLLPSEDDLRRIVREENRALLEEMKEKMKEEDVWYTRKQLAEMFDVGEDAIIGWENKGILKRRKIGGRVYYKKSELPEGD